jgi:hypothetical protein
LRKTAIIFLVHLLFCSAYSQKLKVQNDPTFDDRALHFGFTLGLNTMSFGVKQSKLAADSGFYSNVSVLSPGFNVGMVSDLRLAEYLNLRFLPGLTFGQRTIVIYQNQVAVEKNQVISSSFIDLPLLLKYKARRLNNYRPYLIAGTSTRIDVGAMKAFDEDKKNYIRLKRLDFYYEIGFGVDLYNTYFKLSPEIKFSVGTRDMLVHDTPKKHPEYVEAIQRLTSTLLILSFHFE